MTITLSVDRTKRILAWAAAVSFLIALIQGFFDSVPNAISVASWVVFAIAATLAVLAWLFVSPRSPEPSPLAIDEGPESWNALVRWLRQHGLTQDLDIFLLLAAGLGIVAWSILAADWVDTPGLLFIMWSAAAVGRLLARLRRPGLANILAGTAIGAVVVTSQISRLAEAQGISDRLRETWTRLDVWYEAATTGGISTDLLPFTLAILTFTWLVGFFSSWFLFRHSNVWFAVLLPAIALLTNLSFLSDTFPFRFFLFMFVMMLLVARVTMTQRRQTWEATSVQQGVDSHRFALATAVALTALVLLAAGTVPLYTYQNSAATDLYLTGRSPVAKLEDEFARLFAGIPSRKDLAGRFWGSTLPFQGKIGFDGDVVMWATAKQASYWLAQSYSGYTSKGWYAGATKSVKVGPQSGQPPPQQSANRTPLTQVLEPDFDTLNVMAGGNIQWISREAVVETLAPLEFKVDLSRPAEDAAHPRDVQELAASLRRSLSSADTEYIESEINNMLPQDLVLEGTESTGESSDQGLPVKITLVRKDPLVQEVVAWKFDKQLSKDESYAMGALITTASNDDLREAGSSYGGFITDHYLQLPTSLPKRVGDLAAEVTAGADTPLDKALALQDYLRREEFEYSQEIDPPPRGADGVDYFLFESKEGYSDYFASAMAVMLRAVGVPSRLAAGYAPGVLDPESLRWAIKDSDSHGWTQAYFPGQGWIDFEPTAKWPAARVEEAGASDEDQEDGLEFTSLGGDDLTDPIVQCAELESVIAQAECLEELALGNIITPPFPDQGLLDTLRVPLIVLGIVAVVVAILWAAIRLAWNAGLSKAGLTEQLYTKMSRMGLLAGIGRRAQQTAVEYAAMIGERLPATADAAAHIATAFSADRYGRADLPLEAEEGLTDSWKSIRGTLFLRAIRRTVFLGGA